MGARGLGHIAALCAIAPPRRRRGARRRRRARRGVRLAWRRPRGPRASSSRRCPPTASPCSTPTTTGVAAMAARTTRPGPHLRPRRRTPTSGAVDVELDDRGPGPLHPGARRRAARPSRCGCTASTRSPTPSPRRRSRWAPAGRWPRSPRRCRAADELSPGRMQVVDRADGVTVVHDAYNANPDSMRAALKALVGDGGAAAPHLGRAGGDARARPGLARASTTCSGALVVRLDVDQLLVVGGRRAPGLHRRGHGGLLGRRGRLRHRRRRRAGVPARPGCVPATSSW